MGGPPARTPALRPVSAPVFRLVEMLRGEGEEGRPGRVRGVPAGVLAEADIAVDHRGVDGRELVRSKILPAEQPVDRTGADGREKAALRVHPGVVDLHRAV